VCHIFNFLALISDDSEVGMLDLLLKPIRLWLSTLHNLPRRLRLVNALACGLTATVMSVVVIGSIPYEVLWTWGPTGKPKPNLMGAVMDRMNEIGNGQESGSLEDSVKDFAGTQNLDSNGKQKTIPPKPLDSADCVILGYQLDRERHLDSLLLGTANQGKLVPAGRVTPKLTDQEAGELLATLKAITVKKPFIDVPADDVLWVKPQITCRVKYASQSKEGRLRDLQWEKLLGAMNFK
jgi:hypothetical protein